MKILQLETVRVKSKEMDYPLSKPIPEKLSQTIVIALKELLSR